MTRLRFARAIAAVATAAALRAAPVAAAPPPDVQTYLQKAGFTAEEIGALADGRVIARADSGSIDTELVAVGAVRIRAPRDQTARYFGQMVTWVDGEVTLAFGRFSNPPVASDVKALALERGDIDALRSCRPGNCDLKLGGVGIEAARSSIDWKAGDAADRAQNVFRKAAVDYVAAYLQRGDDALVTFGNASTPISLKEQWRGILADSPYFHQYTPALHDYLVQYPRGSLPGARDILYWIKENYGLKPVVSIVHAVIYDAPDRPDRTTIVQKYLYASHYYDASAAVTTLIDATEGGMPVTYMVYANRSRGDLLKGGFGGLKRKTARDQARKAAQQTLETIQTQLERAAGLR